MTAPKMVKYLKKQTPGVLLMLTVVITALWWAFSENITQREYQIGPDIGAAGISQRWIQLRSKAHPVFVPRVRSYSLAKNNSDDASPDCPTRTTSGPIRRSIHISKETSGVSVFNVSGDGLHNAAVGSPSIFSIKLRTPQQAVNYPDPKTGPFFSVLAVSERHMFTVSPSKVDPKTLSVNFSYTPTFPGTYDLYVEQISARSQTQLKGSPFKLVVAGPPVPEDEIRRRADELPSCQTQPQTDHKWVEGDWVTRELAGRNRGTLRSGWVYQPKKCSLDVFTADDLELAASSPTLRTIVVMGRSTDRGIFLSLVDLILKRSEKFNFVESDLWKCWGFAEVRVGSLRFVFRDVRIESLPVFRESYVDERHVRLTCYGNRTVSRNGNYLDDVIGFLHGFIFKDQPSSWPDVMFLVAKNVDQMRRMMGAMPPTWNGTVYATHNFKLHQPVRFTAEGRESDFRMMKAFSSVDSRIRILDGFALARTMRHTAETGPRIITGHWHKRSCVEYGGTVRVCGDGVEIMAQWLLANAIAPKGKSAWLASFDGCPATSSAGGTGREIRVCHDCQPTFMPFHVQPPNPICYTTRTGLEPRRVDVFRTWDGSFCPEECMKKKPIQTFTVVPMDVRSCSVQKP